MTVTSKRKWRWSSKGLFVPRISSNQTAGDRIGVEDTATSTDPSALFGKSFGSRSTNDGRTALRLPSKKRRTNSRLLSAIGFQQDGGLHRSSKSLSHTGERDSAIALDRNGSKTSYPSFDCKDPCGDLDHPFTVLDTKSTPPNDRMIGNYSHLELASLNVKSREPKGLQQSLSNPSLTHVSHKLSQTFGNPTVVHRPNLRIKPSLISLQNPSSLKVDGERKVERSQQGSTAPSIYNCSGSVFATDPSTGKTSLESGSSTPRSIKHHGGRHANLPESVPREMTLTPIQEVPSPINPTFVTVETTANAKIFFETYFNSLLAGRLSSRSIRKRDLELYFEAFSTPEEQRKIVRWAWAIQESDYLRQIRVLKTKSNRSPRESGVAVAGYEVVRILGKGSFGVVRLVREKEIAADGHRNWHSNSVPSQALHHHIPQDGNTSLGLNNVEALRSTFENHKPAQRQNKSHSRRDVYAMKVIRKSDMLRNCQEGHLRAERDFLVAMEKSRWVVPLIASFQDDTNLYLVMEYMVGGDFLGFLFRKDKLKEKQARWYIAEMILCVEETHRYRWIHRDIKPDNFLISSSGHLKISDFGLAFDGHWAHDQKYYKNTRTSLLETLGIKVKGDFEDQEEDEKRKPTSSLANILTGWRGDLSPKTIQRDGPNERESILQWKNRTGKRRMAASVVGTSQYMAPEVIRGDPYDGRCDWWSISIILYECLYGFTPFVCEKREDTKAKILDNAHSLNFPKERDVERSEKFSFEAMDLINSLLQEKEHRLSSDKYKINDWQQAKYGSGHIVRKCANPDAQDYPGHFVYPNDACDIKAHPYFDRISCERLHLTRPPWVPQVSGNDDTHWFDDEEGAPISEADNTFTESDIGAEADSRRDANGQAARQVRQVDGADAPLDKNCYQPNHKLENEERAKAKKRPRDRVLRDHDIGRKALELRKKGAFLGYTYRRPNLFSFEDEQENYSSIQRSLIPNFQ